jgi:hypothetical protein
VQSRRALLTELGKFTNVGDLSIKPPAPGELTRFDSAKLSKPLWPVSKRVHSHILEIDTTDNRADVLVTKHKLSKV